MMELGASNLWLTIFTMLIILLQLTRRGRDCELSDKETLCHRNLSQRVS